MYLFSHDVSDFSCLGRPALYNNLSEIICAQHHYLVLVYGHILTLKTHAHLCDLHHREKVNEHTITRGGKRKKKKEKKEKKEKKKKKGYNAMSFLRINKLLQFFELETY